MIIWAAEYSLNEDAYHIDTLDKVIKNNLSTIGKGLRKDYLLIGIFREYEEARDFIEKHQAFPELATVKNIE